MAFIFAVLLLHTTAASVSMPGKAFTTTTVAGVLGGGGASVDGVGTLAQFMNVFSLALQSGLNGKLYIAEGAKIRTMTPGGVVTTLAPQPGDSQTFSYPGGLAVSSNNVLYISDTQNHVLRSVNPAGTITLLAGGGGSGPGSYGCVPGVGPAAKFYNPKGIALSPLQDVLYIVDSTNHAVRNFTIADSTVRSLAGGGLSGCAGGNVDGVGTNALFNQPTSIAVAPSGNLFISHSNKVVSIAADTLSTATFAGGGAGANAQASGYADGFGTNALFLVIYALVVDSAGTIFVADAYSNKIRAITPAGYVSTIAGLGSGYASGAFNGLGTNAAFHTPSSIVVSNAGVVFVGDSDNNAIRALTPTPCPAGYFCMNGSISTCLPGFYCPANSSAPTACPSNYYSTATSAPSIATCTPCPVGSSCPTKSTVVPCPIGYICPTAGQPPVPCPAGSYSPVTSRTSCLLCPSGSWSSAIGASFCGEFCVAGTFRSRMGGTSAANCTACPTGSFSDSDGATACTQCAAGSASNVTGAVSQATCVACSSGAVALAGATVCTACPTGTSPDAQKATCVSSTFTCPAGFAAASSKTATTLADCAVLQCASPLAFNTGHSSCVGCVSNSSGVFPACAACASGALCPGLTAAPIPRLSFSTAPAATCALLTGPQRLDVVLPVKTSRPCISWLFNDFTMDTTVLSFFGLALLVLMKLFASLCMNHRFFTSLLEAADLFAFAPPLNNGKYRPRAIGGALSMLAAICFFALATLQFLQRAADNVSVVRSLVVLDNADVVEALALPPFTAAPWGSGVQVRVTAAGNAGACASPLSWSAVDSGWSLNSVSTCGTSGASQHVFSCAACTLSPNSALAIVLDYSCQSLLVEVGALDAAGTVTAYSIPAAQTTAAANGALIESVAFTIPTLLSVFQSKVNDDLSARGFTLLAPVFTVEQALPTTTVGGTVIVPSAATVKINVALPVSPFVALTLESEKVSMTMLLSSIVGLAGIFGFFATVLNTLDFWSDTFNVVLRRKGTALEHASHSSAAEARLPSRQDPLHLRAVADAS